MVVTVCSTCAVLPMVFRALSATLRILAQRNTVSHVNYYCKIYEQVRPAADSHSSISHLVGLFRPSD